MEGFSINNLFINAIESIGYSKEDQSRYLTVFDTKRKIQTITLLYTQEERQNKIEECLDELKSRHSLMNLLFLRYTIESIPLDNSTNDIKSEVDTINNLNNLNKDNMCKNSTNNNLFYILLSRTESIQILESGFGSNNENFLNNLLELIIYINTNFQIKIDCLESILSKYDLINKESLFKYLNMDIDLSPLLFSNVITSNTMNNTCICSLFIKKVVDDILSLDKIENEFDFLFRNSINNKIKVCQLINEKYLNEIENKFINKNAFKELKEMISTDSFSSCNNTTSYRYNTPNPTTSSFISEMSNNICDISNINNISSSMNDLKCEKASLSNEYHNSNKIHFVSYENEISKIKEEVELNKYKMEISKYKSEVNKLKSELEESEKIKRELDKIKIENMQMKLENAKISEENKFNNIKQSENSKSSDINKSADTIKVNESKKTESTVNETSKANEVKLENKPKRSGIFGRTRESPTSDEPKITSNNEAKPVTESNTPNIADINANNVNNINNANNVNNANLSASTSTNTATSTTAPSNATGKVSRLGGRLGQKPKKSLLVSDKSYTGMKWKKANKTQSHIFSKINYEIYEKMFDITEFDKFEFKQATGSISSTVAKNNSNLNSNLANSTSNNSTNNNNTIMHCMDPKKSYALNIALGRLKYNNKDLINKINNNEFNDENIIKQLIMYFPTKDELSLINDASVPLSRAEMLFKEVDDINLFYTSLISLRFYFSFIVRDYKTVIISIKNSFKRILESSELLNLFGILLVMGNVLNSNTFNGNAEGFSLESLDHFENESILNILRKKVIKSRLYQELGIYETTSDTDMGNISNINNFNNVEVSLMKGLQVENIISEINELKVLFIEEFIDSKNKNSFKDILEEFKEMQKYYKDLQDYFGEKDDKFIIKLEKFIKKL